MAIFDTLKLICIPTGLLLSAVLTGRFLYWAERKGILIDTPNHRSSHSRPIVRGAGIIFAALSILAWTVLAVAYQSWPVLLLILGASMLTLVSFLDDAIQLPISTRLSAQIVVALIFLAGVPAPNVLVETTVIGKYIWLPMGTFFIVAVINLFNFMDGIDGLLGLQSILLLTIWLGIQQITGISSVESNLCFILLTCLLGFISYNWQPAKVFMGDAGSTFLGYFFACLTMLQVPGLERSDNFFILVLLMLPVLFDATFTLLVRLLRGDNCWEPHQRHLFQRLVKSGLSHATVACIYGSITVWTGLVVLLVKFELWSSYSMTAGAFLIPYFALYFLLRQRESTFAGLMVDNSKLPNSTR